MTEILNKHVKKKLEEMDIEPTIIPLEEQKGELLSYLEETLSNSYIMGFLNETEECLHVGSEDRGGGHEDVLKLKKDGFYIASCKQQSGQRGDDEKISVREIPIRFNNLTAEQYRGYLNTNLESAITCVKKEYERLRKLFKKE